MEHHRITDETEIPDLCKKTFLTLDKALLALWLAAGLAITGIGGAVTWAFATNASIITLKEKNSANEQINASIIAKLDILIARKEFDK